MKAKKVPMRMCLGCRQMLPKKDLIRIVLPKEGELSADPTGTIYPWIHKLVRVNKSFIVKRGLNISKSNRKNS